MNDVLESFEVVVAYFEILQRHLLGGTAMVMASRDFGPYRIPLINVYYNRWYGNAVEGILGLTG
jgi:hypothetical protein